MTYVGLFAVMAWITVFPVALAVLAAFELRRSRISGGLLAAATILSVVLAADIWGIAAVTDAMALAQARAIFLFGYGVQAGAMVVRAIVSKGFGPESPGRFERATAISVWTVLVLLLVSVPALVSFGKGLGQI